MWFCINGQKYPMRSPIGDEWYVVGGRYPYYICEDEAGEFVQYLPQDFWFPLGVNPDWHKGDEIYE